jgi:hypothetical protein
MRPEICRVLLVINFNLQNNLPGMLSHRVSFASLVSDLLSRAPAGLRCRTIALSSDRGT